MAELRSFSKTAEKHFLSQSAISQQLAQLEFLHRCQLVNRSKRPIELTKQGRVLYMAAKEIVQRYERLKSELKAATLSTQNRIKLAAIFSIGMHTLPDYLKQFMGIYPKVNIHIEYFNADTIYKLILSGDFDIGLVALPKKDKRLKVYEFENEPVVLACSPAHQLANYSKIDIHRIQLEPFIAFAEGVPTRIWIDSILAGYNIAIRPVMEFDNIETIKRAVEINSGISILPVTAISQETSSGTIKAVGFSNESFVRPTGIIIRKDKTLAQPGRYLIELLRKKRH